MRATTLVLALLTITTAAAPAASAQPTTAPATTSQTASGQSFSAAGDESRPRTRYRHYVALGDSYASGPGIPTQNGTPLGCGRSDHNYPGKLARWLRVRRFTDVTCGGATTAEMTRPQQVYGGENPPQFDALRPETDLVTLTIGGNDIGFGEILSTCGRLGATDPTGAPCKAHYTASGTDELANRVRAVARTRVAKTLGEIHKRVPRATILVVGYLRILPDGPGCWPLVPFAAGDTAYFDQTGRALNQALAETARQAGATFINPYPYATNHDACQSAEDRWVEPLRPDSPAAPLHPNDTGMTVVAALAWLAVQSH
ncbi:SGNH/GDSL hydrolase family protein [Actinokineospora auranticolor]|uniref:GDSL-like lipase/acylhydrolase family protein n=1 Tax=Actinokineospora auranticolor TaxID=155976 RepID=A0A2S6GBF9_9PSEU|nr:SGNH/GDSL hydrolase family protein [Actinokineospora auranticolor]PPK61328.1 GDSL-like lipase/acylhydrolase family protein [Actinokineospora auranticolor]